MLSFRQTSELIKLACLEGSLFLFRQYELGSARPILFTSRKNKIKSKTVLWNLQDINRTFIVNTKCIYKESGIRGDGFGQNIYTLCKILIRLKFCRDI